MNQSYTQEHSFELDWLAPLKSAVVALVLCGVIISGNLVYKTVIWSSVNTIEDVIEVANIEVTEVVTNPVTRETQILVDSTYTVNHSGIYTWMGREWCYSGTSDIWRRYTTLTNTEFKAKSALSVRPWAFSSNMHSSLPCVIVVNLLFTPQEALSVAPLAGKYVTPSYNTLGPIEDPNPKIPNFPEDNIPVLFNPFKLGTEKQ